MAGQQLRKYIFICCCCRCCCYCCRCCCYCCRCCCFLLLSPETFRETEWSPTPRKLKVCFMQDIGNIVNMSNAQKGFLCTSLIIIVLDILQFSLSAVYSSPDSAPQVDRDRETDTQRHTGTERQRHTYVDYGRGKIKEMKKYI